MRTGVTRIKDTHILRSRSACCCVASHGAEAQQFHGKTVADLELTHGVLLLLPARTRKFGAGNVSGERSSPRDAGLHQRMTPYCLVCPGLVQTVFYAPVGWIFSRKLPEFSENSYGPRRTSTEARQLLSGPVPRTKFHGAISRKVDGPTPPARLRTKTCLSRA